MPKKKLTAKDYIAPTAFIILLTFVFIAGIRIAAQNGYTIPGLGSIGSIGGNSTSTGGTGGSSSSSGGNGGMVMPVGKVSFNMALIADWSDGTSQSIYQNNGLPGFGVLIQVGGRNVSDVRAQVWVGYTLANSLPAGSNAKVEANVTMTNEKTGHVSWKDYVYNLPIGGTTTTVVQQLPDFAVTGIDVFADACSKLTNGTISCTGTGVPAPKSRLACSRHCYLDRFLTCPSNVHR